MTFTKIAFISLAVSACSMSVQAQDSGANDDLSGAYGELGVIAYDDDLSGIEAKLGYNFNKYFGVEAQGSLGTNRESETFSFPPDFVTVGVKVDYSVAAFAVARLPLSKNFQIFARGGLHNTQVSAEIEDNVIPNFNETATGFAVGGGVQYNFDKKNGIRLEYTYLDGVDADTSSLAYVRKF